MKFNFCPCPRCGERSFEHLTTYSHCFACLYSEDSWQSPDMDSIKAERVLREYEDSPIDDATRPEVDTDDLVTSTESSAPMLHLE